MILTVALAALASTTPLSRGWQECATGCLYEPNEYGLFDAQRDLTVLSSAAPGLVWNLRLESSDPNATLFINGPSYFDVYDRIRTETGIITEFEGDYDRAEIGFQIKQILRPGRTTVLMSFDRPFDFCSEPGPIGEICGRRSEIIFNSAQLVFEANAPVTIFFSETAMVPEPATWAMMIGGFGMIGGAIRRRARLTLTSA